MAIAAYNCGPGNVDRAVERTGYADVWELRNRGVLPLETSNYVPIILAMTIMAKNPASYGLSDIIPDEPLQYDTVEMTAMTGLALIADLTGQPVSAIREINPALLKDVAPASYKLHVPKGTLVGLMAGLEFVPENKRLSWRAYRADAGEDIGLIARRFGTSASSLLAVNPDLKELTEAGALVLVPAAPAPAPRVVVAKARPRVPVRTSTAKRPVVVQAKPGLGAPTRKPVAAAAQKRSPRG